MVTKHIMLVLGLMGSVDRDEQRYWTEDQIKSNQFSTLAGHYTPSNLFGSL